MIVGTAGHIDHGKTTLVRALTGVDTDRLKEEKARGISIELGYAYAPVLAESGQGAADMLCIIDVPGHEKFVHTMAAGASGIDHVLLVVAADDGVMPQTREHLAIVELFGISQGTVALTKTDRVDAARIAAVRAEVGALLAASPLRGAPVFETAVVPASGESPGDGPHGAQAQQGIDALRQHLFARARLWQQRRSDGLFRLAIDRVFTLAGHGTVVTGTVFGGRVAVGDTLTHAGAGPKARSVRVRGLHAQNRAAEIGTAGQRVALNLAGIDRHEMTRGDWIADARVLQPSLRVDVRVRLLADVPGAAPLSTWAPLHVHLGAAHRQAHAVPLQGDRVAPGAEARVQLVFDKPVFVVPGDRFILRNAQGTRTVGGGVVLDSLAPERRRRSAERMQWLDAMETLVAEGDARPLLAVAPAGLLRSSLARLLGRWPEPGWDGDDALAFALGKSASSGARAAAAGSAGQAPGAGVDAAGDMLWLAPAAWAAVRARIAETLERHHARAPDEPGLNSASLQRMAFPAQGGAQASFARLHPQGWQAWIDRLLVDGTLERTGHWLHLPSHRVTLNDAERALAERLLRLLQAGGNDPPWVRDLARDTRMREDAVRDLLRKQARIGALYQVVKDLFYPAERMAELARIFADLTDPADLATEEQAPTAEPGEHAPKAAKQARSRLPPGAVEARAFRDAVQVGRKRAIQILECFDRVGYTRRVGDAHLVRPNTRWAQEGPVSGP
jgi:selenocysteine-specific elongation factor